LAVGTERTDAETSQQVSDERYHALFDCAPDGILIADRESYYIDANASICRMLGYSRAELIGLHGSDIVLPSEVERIAPALALIVEGADFPQEWQFRRKDGSSFSADVTVTVMPGGNLLAMIRDLTAKHQADEAVRATEERTQFALRSANVGVWDMDYRSGVLRWSEVMETQYGLAPGTFAGTFDAFTDRIHPADRPSVLEVLGKAMKTGADFSGLHRTTWPDGTLHWLSGTGRIVLDEGGHPVRSVGISQDVTERLALEAQFQQAQKMEAVGRLAGGVAHDFNNLLTVILGFCELLLTSVTQDDPRRRDVVEIQKAGTRAASLTRQLLAFSRKELIEPTLLDLHTVLIELRPMLGRLLREDVTVMGGTRRALARVRADRGQVEQVVLNLAVNAQDAMPNGGTLTIETADIELDEHDSTSRLAPQPGRYVVLTVTDSGTGMTPEAQEHLFEPFFTTKEPGKGTGLGLATVHGIVTRSGGSVSVHSEPGRGTSFKVYFPQAPAADTTIDVPERPAPPRPGSETVLVVEDSRGLRDLTKRLLERRGYTVIVAANAEEASRLFEETPSIDVLLTDVVMPGKSGPELIKRLAERRPTLKVLYMSGYTDEAIVQHNVLKPGIAFLHKPFTSDTLERKLREVLDR
jgi:PAS domain S-box-containing protein